MDNNRHNKIYLVSCVGRKSDRPAPARDLYISHWFTKARTFVEQQNAPWYILSAEYGLVSPKNIIAPYEKTLNRMPVRERKAWAERVLAQLRTELGRTGHVVMLAGERYREFLMDGLRTISESVEVPMQGLAIGEQLQWLKRRTIS